MIDPLAYPLPFTPSEHPWKPLKGQWKKLPVASSVGGEGVTVKESRGGQAQCSRIFLSYSLFEAKPNGWEVYLTRKDIVVQASNFKNILVGCISGGGGASSGGCGSSWGSNVDGYGGGGEANDGSGAGGGGRGSVVGGGKDSVST
ncbi:putative lysozyme-like protein [Papaver somniferum]|uniref:putative lysozyme-like protein n=1 Tax=Papaver somniferum TaxID=3469 RepID=UPI000E705090|nr:putative lysozyme-like protein [Papaver somniferum]